MRVLVIEDRDRQIEPAISALRDASHEITFCHEPGDAAFECNGMPGRSGCPLDDGSIDVAVLGRGPGVRVGTAEEVVQRESGVGCARRQRVPVVLVGPRTPADPPEWATDAVDVGDPDLVERVDAAARKGQAPLIEAIETTTRDALGTIPTTVAVVARVVREHRRLRVTVDVDAELDARLRDRVAVRVAGAVRALDAASPTIDVAVYDSTHRR